MRSHLLLAAAASVAFGSGCSSGPNTSDHEERLVGTDSVSKPSPPAWESSHDREIAGNRGGQRLATGQYVTPVALPGAVQQLLNPGLAAYPSFVAGEAVRSQLSPDGS